MANTNTYVYERSKSAFRVMLIDGHFPEVQYKETEQTFGKSTSYSLMDYTRLFSKFRTIVHEKLQEQGYEKGIFATRLRSKEFKATVDNIIIRITPENVLGQGSRLRTMFD